MYSHAIISDCKKYRYRLIRGEGDLLAVCMLNPSKADAEINDPTITRLLGYAKREGLGGIDVMNLFAWRDTDPANLKERECVGPLNDDFLSVLSLQYDRILVGWGSLKKNPLPGRAKRVAELLTAHGASLVCLGVNGDGSPRHPLYIRADAPLLPWSVA